MGWRFLGSKAMKVFCFLLLLFVVVSGFLSFLFFFVVFVCVFIADDYIALLKILWRCRIWKQSKILYWLKCCGWINNCLNDTHLSIIVLSLPLYIIPPPLRDHNGNKCLPFFVLSLVLMYMPWFLFSCLHNFMFHFMLLYYCTICVHYAK